MGCVCLSRNHFTSAEKKYFSPVEDSLGFDSKTSKEIDRILHRNSTHNKISLTQLRIICTMLCFKFESLLNFFAYFSNGDYYLTKKLNCAGILLGKGSQAEKLILLFQNYDIDLSGTLSDSEISIMIDDLLTVACIIIPTHAFSMQMDDQELGRHVLNLKTIYKGMHRQYLGLLLDNKKEISLTEFEICFQYSVVAKLLCSKDLREYAFQLYMSVIGPAEIVMETMKDESARKELTKKLSVINHSPQKRKSKRKINSWQSFS